MRITLCALAVTMFVGLAQARESRSLAGPWSFRLDSHKVGANEKWYAAPLAGNSTIKLPGTMDDAGLGPRNTKPPTLEGPYRLYDYAGPAWYQREIEIPSSWSGNRISLFLERCRWVTDVWLDDQCYGSQDSLIAPHVYDFGTGVKPGKHRLTICVDNTVKIHLGKFVSALFGGTWGNMNGIIGRIELNATPPVWIDDVQVHRDDAFKKLHVKVRIGNATDKAGAGELSSVVNDGSTNPEIRTRFQCSAHGKTENEIVIPLDSKLWDEFSPHLFKIRVKSESGDGMTDSWEIETGVREFSAKGTQFTMNGRPVFLRGTLECSVWPLTGYPPMDVEGWRRIYRIIKSYGLNYMRFHSWCPPEAAFAAADIEGVILQVEGPMANVSAGSDPERDAFIEAEFKRIVDTYGNHPSFCLMALGNEYGGDNELLTRWVGMLRERDSRHLYSSASNNRQRTMNRQFTVTPQGRGIPGPGTDRDLRKIVAGDPHPVLGHEIGQWMYWPDFDEIKKWSGVMALKNFKMIRADMRRKHLLDLEPQYIQACGRFATLLYKEEVEVLLRTPNYAGFALLDLHDYPTQGTALVGPLDAFWNSKGFITPEGYRRFAGPTVPLLRMPKRTYTTDEPFTARVEVAHFGPSVLMKVQPTWTIKNAQGREVASGKLDPTAVPTGQLTPLGEITTSLARADAPSKLTVTVALGDFSNDWEIWLYPPSVAVDPPGQIAVCRQWGDATEALGEGKTVMLFPKRVKRSLPGKFLPVFWSPVWFPSQKPNTNGILCDPKHPAFSQFPTDGYSNWQWWDLLNHSRSIILDDTPAEFRPVVQVMDNFARNHKLGNLIEARVGKGKLLVCSIDLPGLADKSPAARQLMHSLYRYAASPSFNPSQTLEPEVLDGIFGSKLTNSLKRLGATVRADSQAPGYEAALAMDGDPETCWHTKWEPSPKPMPHELIVEFREPTKLAGITCLPRQDMANGRIKRCEVLADGKPVAAANWPNSPGLQTLRFKQPIRARKLTLRIESEVNGNPFAGVAELDVLSR